MAICFQQGDFEDYTKYETWKSVWRWIFVKKHFFETKVSLFDIAYTDLWFWNLCGLLFRFDSKNSGRDKNAFYNVSIYCLDCAAEAAAAILLVCKKVFGDGLNFFLWRLLPKSVGGRGACTILAGGGNSRNQIFAWICQVQFHGLWSVHEFPPTS